METKRSYTGWLVLFCLIGVLAIAGTYWMEQTRTADNMGSGIQVNPNGDGGQITVSVTGEVKQPGTYRIAAYGRYSDAIYAAGGATNRAYIDPALLDKPLSDGDEIVLPSAENAGGQPPVSDGKATPKEKIDINTAGKAALMRLPGIGEVMADRIIAYREEYGGFQRAEELMNVSGIGEKKFANIKPYVTVLE